MAACLALEVVDTRFASLLPISRMSLDSCTSASSAMGTCQSFETHKKVLTTVRLER